MLRLDFMPSSGYSFLFSYVSPKQTLSTRKVHIRRLYDVLELSIHRDDLVRARKAWAILVRCKEVDWKIMWKTGALLAGAEDKKTVATQNRVEYLITMLLQYPEAVSRFPKLLSLRIARLTSSVAGIYHTRNDLAPHLLTSISSCIR